jgi:KUP system potassium uptake protein
MHRTVLLTTVTTEEVPHVTGDRASIEQIGDGLYRVMLRYGFMDEPHVHHALAGVLDRIAPGTDSSSLTYVLGQERIVPGEGGRMGHAAETIFATLSRNAANPSDFFDLPASQVVEVGSRVDL